MEPSKADVVVVGGGVIGICTAYYAASRGASVIVLERDRIPCGSSYGNAGLVVPSHCHPLAAPGMVAEGLKHVFNPSGAFSIPLRLDPKLLGWLWKFRRHCCRKHLLHGVGILKQLGMDSFRLHRELAETAGGKYQFGHTGLLSLYATSESFEEARGDAKLLGRFGIDWKLLSGNEARKMDPSVGPQVAGAVYHGTDGRVHPADFVKWLAGEAEAKGVRFETETEVFGFGKSGRRIVGIQTTRGDFLGKQVVLAAGAWLSGLARELGVRLPVLGGKGYSLTFRRPEACPRHPLLLEESRIAVTPFEKTFRLTGFLELSGTDLSIEGRRFRDIRRQARAYLPYLGEMTLLERWRGLRPCTPDGLPVVGRVPGYDNVWAAGGHATKGVSLGPVTGRLMGELLAGKSGGDLERALSPARF